MLQFKLDMLWQMNDAMAQALWGEPVSAPSRQPPARCIGAGMRLQWEPAQDAHVLLYPEGMVKLNDSAGEILSRCDGVRTVADIVADLERTYELTGLAADVTRVRRAGAREGWLELRT